MSELGDDELVSALTSMQNVRLHNAGIMTESYFVRVASNNEIQNSSIKTVKARTVLKT